MKIYSLIHEQDTDAICGCDVNLFTDKQTARSTMREEWQEAVETSGYDSKEHHDEDVSECGDDSAVIRDGGDLECWRIKEHELDVRVAVKVEGGLVQGAIANAGVDVDVYDLDVSSFPEEGEENEADIRRAEYEKLSDTPGWRMVY